MIYNTDNTDTVDTDELDVSLGREVDPRAPYDHFLEESLYKERFKPGTLLRFPSKSESWLMAGLKFSLNGTCSEGMSSNGQYTYGVSLSEIITDKSFPMQIVYLGYSIEPWEDIALVRRLTFRFLCGERLAYQHRLLHCRNMENEFGISEIVSAVEHVHQTMLSYFVAVLREQHSSGNELT